MKSRHVWIGAATIFLGLLLVPALFLLVGRLSPSQNQVLNMENSSSTVSAGQEIFISGVPVDKFDHLDIYDLPELPIPTPNFAIATQDAIYVAGALSIVKYDRKGNFLGMVDKGTFYCSYVIPLKIHDTLYLRCLGKGIAEINLKTDKLVYLHVPVPVDGNQKIYNIGSIASDGKSLWVGTQFGPVRIDTTTRQSKLYGPTDIHVPIGNNGVDIYGYRGDVWAVVRHYPGDFVLHYLPQTDGWKVFGPNDFGYVASTSSYPSIFGLSQNSDGVFINLYNGHKNELYSYDAARDVWNHRETGDANVVLPTPDKSDSGIISATATSFVLTTPSGSSEVISFQPDIFRALSQRFDGIYYVLSDQGLNVLHRGDRLPQLIVKGDALRDNFSSSLFVTPDRKYAVTFGAEGDPENELFGGILAYDFGLFDITEKNFKYLRIATTPTDQYLQDQVSFSEKLGKIVITFGGKDHFQIDPALKTVKRIR